MKTNLRSVTTEKRELQMMRLMPATLAAVTKIAFTFLCCTLLMLVAAPAWAQAPLDPCNDPITGALPLPAPTPPPVLPAATGCGALIKVTGVDGGNATFFTVTNTGNGNPYDGAEDTLVGIVNNSGHDLNSITLSSTTSPIFGFDGDGPCQFSGHVAKDCNGPNGYEGPNQTFTFTVSDTMNGTVTFTHPIPNTGSTWFALEGTPDSLTSVTVSQLTPPGVTTLFDFGPFNWKSTPAATTGQNGSNSLDITAIPLAPGTTITFGDGSHGTCITYNNTGGNCRAFNIKCNGPDCDATTYFAEFSTAYDVDADHIIQRPGLAKGDPDCGILTTLPPPDIHQPD